MNRVFKISYNIVKSFYLLLFRKQTKKLTSHQKLKRIYVESRKNVWTRFEYDCLH